MSPPPLRSYLHIEGRFVSQHSPQLMPLPQHSSLPPQSLFAIQANIENAPGLCCSPSPSLHFRVDLLTFPLTTIPIPIPISITITIMSTQSILLALAVAAQSVLGAPATTTGRSLVEARAIIDHDAVVGFAEAVPANTEGTLMLKYKPYLKVFNGCVPFPAVDADGNTRYA